MCVKATASQIWDIFRHSVVATTLLHQDPVDAAIYHLHLQKSNVLTGQKIYRTTHKAKMHHFFKMRHRNKTYKRIAVHI